MLKNSYWQSVLLLVFTNVIWGTTFPLLKDAIANLSPSVLIGSRFIIAALAFLPLCRNFNKQLIRDGAILGVVLFAAFATQVIGLESTSANRAAFITSLNVILVPILGALLGQALPRKAFVAAGVALAGIGVMSWEGGSVTVGDLWVFGCALSYAVYILLLEAVAQKHKPTQLTALQLIVVAVLGAVWAAPNLLAQVSEIGANLAVIFYLGAIATAAATWIQAVAQRSVSASQTAVIYTLEPVFAAIFSFWWLRESLGVRGLLGAGMVLLAMVLSQVRE